MPEYIYNPDQDQNYFNRFPEDSRGFDLWRRLVSEPNVENLKALQNLVKNSPPPDCPCLFVSHRQVDRDNALSMAYLAFKNNFKYWVDVLNPYLQAPNVTANAILTAGIIEMALLNCTHVIALMTLNTPGSAWVPYEYGRLAEYPVLTQRAAAWRHPNFQQADIPEYMLLRDVHETVDLPAWFNNEYYLWFRSSNSRCNPVWIGPTAPYPPNLP